MKRALAILAASLSGTASADPLRLRADALASTTSPAGLLVLDANGEMQPNLSAEAVVWMAGNHELDGSNTGDVLVIAVDAKTDDGRAGGRLGRFVGTLGALRPVHMDGAALRFRLPGRIDLEAIGGMPVVPETFMSGRAWDWVAGGRVARRFGDWGSVGLAYEQRRDDGMLVSEEVGADAGISIGNRSDLGGRVAYDVANPGIAEVALTASHRGKTLRAELYASHLAASHLLPATSLFSVIGDVPSQRAGAVITWTAAPRLDITVDGGARRVDSDIAPDVTARARLKLDARGTSSLSGELRRDGVGDEAWSGARAAARIALGYDLAVATELELVRPDDPRGRGNWWPWALGALSWDSGLWNAAFALEASSTPEYHSRYDALFQLGRRWGIK